MSGDLKNIRQMKARMQTLAIFYIQLYRQDFPKTFFFNFIVYDTYKVEFALIHLNNFVSN